MEPLTEQEALLFNLVNSYLAGTLSPEALYQRLSAYGLTELFFREYMKRV
jgi:hypothetical protein